MSSILVLSVIDTLISAIGYYLVGFAFTLGDGNPSNGENQGRTYISVCVTVHGLS